ncbi:MAG: hypothetical protein ACRCWF_03400 [Beijerinckiaceae bacterium]
MQKTLWILALAVAGLLAGCGVPPTLTANATYTENFKNDYFDRNLRFANYNQAESIADFFERKIIRLGDNENSKLLQIMTDSGGQCNTSGVTYRCTIDRNYISNSCAFGKCSRSKRHWNLSIKWNSSTQNFKPEVRVVISKLVSIDQSY